MTGFFRADADADAAIARVEQQIAAAQEQAQRAHEFQGRIAAVRGVARSPRGHVEVAVDAGGRLSAVDLSPAAMDLSPRELSALLVETAQTAQRVAGEQAVQLAEEAFGADSGAVGRLRAEVDDLSAREEGDRR